MHEAQKNRLQTAPSFLKEDRKESKVEKCCWICNERRADSGEHKVKKSDLSMVLGKPTQNKPAYFHSSKGKNRHIRSVDAKILKFSNSICQYCNNTRTQPHDRSWDRFFEYIHKSNIVPGTVIRGKSIFSYNSRQEMLNVHLRFLKHFGCFIDSGRGNLAVGGNHPLEDREVDKLLKSFSHAILENKLHQNVYIEFYPSPVCELEVVAGCSNLEIIIQKGCIIAAFCAYDIGHLSVGILYDSEGHWHDPAKVWHPRYGHKRITIIESPEVNSEKE